MRWLLAPLLALGCSKPCPPPTVIVQQAPPSTTATQPDPTQPDPPTPTQPTEADIDPRYRPPTSGPVPLISTGQPLPTTTGSQFEIAADKHWEGEQLYASQRYAEASARFRDAVARVPEARYFYNLCASLYMEGKFGEALVACDAVQRNHPTAELAGKAKGLMVRIGDEAKAQGIRF